MTSEVFDIIHGTAERFLAGISGCENWASFDDFGISDELLKEMHAYGLCRAGLPEALGGAGFSLIEVMKLVQLSGYYASPLPFSESLVGHWIAGLAGFDIPDGSVLTLVDDKANAMLSLSDDGLATGKLRRVPYGDVATHFLCAAVDVNDNAILLCVETSDLNVVSRSRPNLAKFPLADFQINSVPVAASRAISEVAGLTDLFTAGALMRCFELAGGMRRAVEITVNYVKERKQFGRPVAKFQAVQHMLAIASEHAAATEISAHAAALADPGSAESQLKVAASKSWASKSVTIVADACHQSHGAMGFTREYNLHYFTRRLWAWREEFGSEFEWQRFIGDIALKTGSDGLWDMVIGRHLGAASRQADL